MDRIRRGKVNRLILAFVGHLFYLYIGITKVNLAKISNYWKTRPKVMFSTAVKWKIRCLKCQMKLNPRSDLPSP